MLRVKFMRCELYVNEALIFKKDTVVQHVKRHWLILCPHTTSTGSLSIYPVPVNWLFPYSYPEKIYRYNF